MVTMTDKRSEEYNGWTNRETWCAALWINNDQGMQEYAAELARRGVDAEAERKLDGLVELGFREFSEDIDRFLERIFLREIGDDALNNT